MQSINPHPARAYRRKRRYTASISIFRRASRSLLRMRMRAELSAPGQLKNDGEPALIREAVEIENAALVLDLEPSRLLGHEHIVCLSHVLARVVFLGAIDDEVRSHFDFTVA